MTKEREELEQKIDQFLAEMDRDLSSQYSNETNELKQRISRLQKELADLKKNKEKELGYKQKEIIGYLGEISKLKEEAEAVRYGKKLAAKWKENAEKGLLDIIGEVLAEEKSSKENFTNPNFHFLNQYLNNQNLYKALDVIKSLYPDNQRLHYQLQMRNWIFIPKIPLGYGLPPKN